MGSQHNWMLRLAGLLAGFLLLGSTANAQVDLNKWFYPSAWSDNGGARRPTNNYEREPEYQYDAPPRRAGEYERPRRDDSTGQPMTGNRQAQYQSAPREYREAPADYQTSEPGTREWNGPNYRSPPHSSNTYNKAAYWEPDRPDVSRNAPTRRPAMTAMRSDSMNYPSVAAPRRDRFAGASSNATPNETLPEPVYINGTNVTVGRPGASTSNRPVTSGPPTVMRGSETLPPGSVMYGNVPPGGEMMPPGPPMYGHPSDGLLNPFCNDCHNGSCGGCGGGGCGYGGDCGYGGCGGGCDDGCCDECCGGNHCGGGCHDYGRPWILYPIDWVFGTGPFGDDCGHCGWWWGEDLTVFGGVLNFKSPIDSLFARSNSNFGFQEGVNWGAPIWQEWGLGGQIGYQAMQSDLAGTFNSNSIRTQSFLTAALFHRAGCGECLQYGMAFDWLHDDFFEAYDVAQLRGQISWLCDCQDEIGFWFGVGVKQAGSDFFEGLNYEALDQYNFFYRRMFCRGGDVRLQVGWVGGSITRGGGSGGNIGVDFEVPIACSWAIEGGFNYVIVGNNRNNGFIDETWNLGCNLVWYFGGNARCTGGEYRPMFNVADNGSFMTTLR